MVTIEKLARALYDELRKDGWQRVYTATFELLLPETDKENPIWLGVDHMEADELRKALSRVVERLNE